MTIISKTKTLGGYAEFVPENPLSRYIECYWTYDGTQNNGEPVSHRVLPDPDPSIVLKAEAGRDGRFEGWNVCLFGPITTQRMFAPRPSEILIGAKIKAEWSNTILGAPGFTYADFTGPLEDVNRALAGLLKQALGNAATGQEAILSLVKALPEACPDAGSAGVIQNGAALIRRTAGALTPGALIEALDVSERHLLRIFREALGLGPKAFARGLRFLNAVGVADNMLAPDWAGIAAETGYFDQSHMIRDFRRFSGRTPAKIFLERRAESVLSNT